MKVSVIYFKYLLCWQYNFLWSYPLVCFEVIISFLKIFVKNFKFCVAAARVAVSYLHEYHLNWYNCYQQAVYYLNAMYFEYHFQYCPTLAKLLFYKYPLFSYQKKISFLNQFWNRFHIQWAVMHSHSHLCTASLLYFSHQHFHDSKWL